MKIFVSLVSANDQLRRYFGEKKDSLIARDILSRGFFAKQNVRILSSSYVPPTDGPTSIELEHFISPHLESADACLLIVDHNWLHLTNNIRNAAFIVRLDKFEAEANIHNSFNKTMARAMKAFGQLLSRFQGHDGELLSLPLRNFNADELKEIARLCCNENTSALFGERIEEQLVLLRRRRRPRRRSEYKTVYTVDDLKRLFVYGKEKHARFETGGDHRISCAIAGHMRFGKKIDSERHFNVSETESDTTSITGAFCDCHDCRHVISARPHRTHLNMFANDFFPN